MTYVAENTKQLLTLSKVFYEEYLYYENFNKIYAIMNRRIRLEDDEMLACRCPARKKKIRRTIHDQPINYINYVVN
jgi:hypothetical protein